MEATVWVPLLSGFAGAVVGAGASVVTTWLQGRREERREVARIAADLARADYQHAIDLVRAHGRGEIAPLATYVFWYSELLRAAHRGELTAEAYRNIAGKVKSLMAAADAA